jgi:hypothetical protein
MGGLGVPFDRCGLARPYGGRTRGGTSQCAFPDPLVSFERPCILDPLPVGSLALPCLPLSDTWHCVWADRGPWLDV